MSQNGDDNDNTKWVGARNHQTSLQPTCNIIIMLQNKGDNVMIKSRFVWLLQEIIQLQSKHLTYSCFSPFLRRGLTVIFCLLYNLSMFYA